MNRECIESYKAKLEKGLMEYMSMPMSQRSAEAVDAMVECWQHVDAMLKSCNCPVFDEKAAMEWNSRMVNEDGTTGGYWTLDDTSAYIPSGVGEYCWNVAMNMVYSDYYDVADKYGINTPKFYADLAKAFLFDKDIEKSPEEKLSAYYYHIVK